MMNEKYADLIKAEVDEADATTSDFRARALTIVTTSGGLVTLLSGLIAVASGGSKTWVLPSEARGPLGWALVLYVVAAVLALLIHIPQKVERATPEALGELLTADDTNAKAISAIADLHLATLTSIRTLNARRAWYLLMAIAAEIAAIAATGLTAWRVVESL
jgi:hypothetical protein